MMSLIHDFLISMLKMDKKKHLQHVYKIQQKTKFSEKRKRLWWLVEGPLIYDKGREYILCWKDRPNTKILFYMLLLIIFDEGSLVVLCGYYDNEGG